MMQADNLLSASNDRKPFHWSATQEVKQKHVCITSLLSWHHVLPHASSLQLFHSLGNTCILAASRMAFWYK